MKIQSITLMPANVWLCTLICLGLLAGTVGAAKAQQFSADIVMTRDNGTVVAGRLRVLDARVRIETPELPNAFFLIDALKPSAYFVQPARHIYMDARQSSRLTRLFIPVDPDEPCRQWQAMAQLADVAGQGNWRCERVGEETIDGRKTVIFRTASAPGREFLGWIDPVLEFPLRIKTEEGTSFALENIRNEPQPASSFELPPDFRKFSPEALVEQIKQSDVWVGEQNGSGSPRR